jgi:hypothetical protein
MIPKELCHYTKRDTALEKILFGRQIKFGQLGFTNDPKESKWSSLGILPLDDKDAMKSLDRADEIINEAQRVYREEWKVLCMTKHLRKGKYKRVIKSYVMSKFRHGYCRPKMWAQYAENHTGVCIVFDGNKLHNKIKTTLEKRFQIFQGSVTYKNYGAAFDKNLDNAYITKHGLTNGIRNFFFENYHEYFLTKYPDWEGESEYRWLIHNPENAPEFVNIEGTIKLILIGSEFPTVYEPAIREVCKEMQVPVGRIRWINGIPNPVFGDIYRP